MEVEIMGNNVTIGGESRTVHTAMAHCQGRIVSVEVQDSNGRVVLDNGIVLHNPPSAQTSLPEFSSSTAAPKSDAGKSGTVRNQLYEFVEARVPEGTLVNAAQEGVGGREVSVHEQDPEQQAHHTLTTHDTRLGLVLGRNRTAVPPGASRHAKTEPPMALVKEEWISGDESRVPTSLRPLWPLPIVTIPTPTPHPRLRSPL